MLARALLVALTCCAALLVSKGARADTRCDDAALSELAALHTLERASATELLERARAHGASYPSLHLVDLAPGDVGAAERWLATLERRGLGPLVCGEALSETSRVLVAAPAQGALLVAADGLRVELAPGFSDPVVYARRGDEEPRAFGVSGGVAQLDPSSLAAPLELQLVASGPDGPRPIAELRLGDPLAARSPSDASVIDWLRERSGRGPLRPNRLLAGVALEHAARVCASGSVAHRIAGGEDARGRLERAHVEARHVGEVVARAADEASGWRALAQSPSHRAALGDPRFTDVGVGVARSSGHTCVVAVLAAWPRRLAR